MIYIPVKLIKIVKIYRENQYPINERQHYNCNQTNWKIV